MNGLFLMFVAFLPFPTTLLGEYGDQLLVVAIYAGSVAITRLVLSAIWWYVISNYRLIDSEGVHPASIRAHHSLPQRREKSPERALRRARLSGCIVPSLLPLQTLA